MTTLRAVVISDVHYNLSTLPLADAAMRQAIQKANELQVPLIVSGDLHDTKASMRGECVNAMIDTFKLCDIRPMVIPGNHCMINEKAKEHSLNFLSPYADIISTPMEYRGFYFIPYQHSADDFVKAVNESPEGVTIICHQGVTDADMGDYVQDRSAVSLSRLKPRTIVSGHYHRAQTIPYQCRTREGMGSFSYVGNPYTLSFGESGDGPKGYALIDSAARLCRVATNLRKHWMLEVGTESVVTEHSIEYNDLVWVKYSGLLSHLGRITKDSLAKTLGLPHNNYKLDLIPTDAGKLDTEVKNLSAQEILDSLIAASGETDAQKEHLKSLWKSMYE